MVSAELVLTPCPCWVLHARLLLVSMSWTDLEGCQGLWLGTLVLRSLAFPPCGLVWGGGPLVSLQGVFFLSRGGSWGLKAQPCSPEGESSSLHAEVPGSASLSSHLLPPLLPAGLRWPLSSVPQPQRVTVCLLIHHWPQ